MKTTINQTNRWIALAVSGLICWCAALACSGGGGGAPEASVVLMDSALKASSIDDIESTQCAAYSGNPKNSSAAFGCAMAKGIKLLDGASSKSTAKSAKSTPAIDTAVKISANKAIADLLTAIGEPVLNVKKDVLDAANPNSLCSVMAQTPTPAYCGNFPKIPFNSWCGSTGGSTKEHLRKALLNLKTNGVSAQQVQDNLFALAEPLQELVTIMEVAKNDPKASFVVPQGFCQLKKDVTLKPADVKAFYSIFAGLKVAINLQHAYTIGLDPAQLVDSKADGAILINQTGFVNDANGGADGKLFAELSAASAYMAPFSSLIMSGLTSTIDVLDAVDIENIETQKAKDTTIIFYKILMAHKDLFRDINRGAKDVKASLEKGVMTPMTHSNSDVQIDVTKGLSKLPDPKAVTGVDPFVVDPKTKLANWVPEFFKALFDGIAIFEIKKVDDKKDDKKAPPSPPPNCLAACTGKQCGSDGCGGVCGSCGESQICSTTNQCVFMKPVITAPASIAAPQNGTAYAFVKISGDSKQTDVKFTCDSKFDLSEVFDNDPAKSGKGLQYLDKETLTVPFNSPATFTYAMTFKNVLQKITCSIEAKNSIGSTTKSLEVNVIDGPPPAVTGLPAKLTVEKGKASTIAGVIVKSSVGFEYVQFFCPTNGVQIAPSVAFDLTKNKFEYSFDLNVMATDAFPGPTGIACSVLTKDIIQQITNQNITIITQ